MTTDFQSIVCNTTYLPELGTDLVTTLTSLKVDDFSHGEGLIGLK
jgi:hypothetical protein